jgi:Tfp pilus assembly protein PilF
MAVMYSIQNETPKPIKLASQDFPAGLQDVLDRAFQKDLDKRWQSAREFRDALSRFLPAGKAAPARQRRGSALKLATIAALVIVAVVVTWLVPRQPATDRSSAQNLNELGQYEDSLGNTPKAAQYYRESIKADGSYAIPWNNLGWLALSAGELEEADSLFREALRRDSGYVDAMYNLGTMAWDRGDTGDAKAWYYRAVEVNSHYAPVLNNLGSILFQEGKKEEARALFLRALDPPPPIPVRAQLHKNLGKVAFAMGDLPGAREHFAECKQLTPNDGEIDSLISEAATQ